MEYKLISLDGKRIGICEGDPAAWFAANSLNPESRTVESVEFVDCHDVESLIAAICARIGVTMQAEFVPFSQSRNAKPRKEDGKVWRSLNWRCKFSRGGKAPFLETDYSQGEAHAPAYKAAKTAFGNLTIQQREAVDHELESGCIARQLAGGVMSGKKIPAPSIGEVMQSLARDSDVFDAGGFENWAADFGYDTDSREAESIYRACLDIALKLRGAIGESNLAELRLAATFN